MHLRDVPSFRVVVACRHDNTAHNYVHGASNLRGGKDSPTSAENRSRQLRWNLFSTLANLLVRAGDQYRLTAALFLPPSLTARAGDPLSVKLSVSH